MGTDSPAPAGELAWLLSAAAHLRELADRRLLDDLALTEKTLLVLNAMPEEESLLPGIAWQAEMGVPETAFALASLLGAGYVRTAPRKRWARTSSGTHVLEKLHEACSERTDESELRRALLLLLQSMDTSLPDLA
ncbi:hypothetical protein LOC59_13495 [Arthrobacter sp. zg-Y916]|uniref:hypothetical protein n=1 Tax=Arthrobacter sp. zg-Y916 TaxID=2894190 RepID=UPI001E61AB35|nr:hypothetical protein [Arthrobacter sp. zg-Y916]MCC9194655.1 hypothetical protein [Arthrobacter sp. zg-Y916]